MTNDVTVLICSYKESKYLGTTLSTINSTADVNSVLIDIEHERSGIENTTHRYQRLFTQTTSRYIVKSDDDVRYFPGWLEECIQVLEENEDVAYVCPMSHKLLPSLHTDAPVYSPGFTYQPFVGGLCWVFRRDLWEQVPYNLVSCIKTIDSFYGNLVRSRIKKSPAYLNSILCSHLGQDRHGGIDV